jgi:4a-hydroxytetrahydrobiopterin dehydratase
MKPSSPRRKPVSRTVARNAALLNQLGTPGLGSLLAGRWIEGVLQLLVFLAGFVLFCLWAFRNIAQYYQMMSNDAPKTAPGGGELALSGVGICALAWVWSLVTSFSLLREVSTTSLQSLESFAAGQLKLDAAQIPIALATVPDWKRQGDVITRAFDFKDFPAAMKFVNAVAELAEQAWHHPDIDIRWNKVTLSLTTHKAGGLTEMDFALAQKFDRLQTAKS